MELFWENQGIQLFKGDARNLDLVLEDSVDLAVTSPPYNVGKDYGDLVNDRKPIEEYKQLLYDAFLELFRVLKDGGRLVVEIGGSGRDFPLTWIVQDTAFDVGFLLRGELVIAHRATNRTAWGSYLCPSNPYTIPNFHMVYMFSKARHDREDLKGFSIPIDPSEWYEWTLGRWIVPYGSHPGHEATFSEEFARRCILLLSGPSDLILDPFVGSGTTCKVALDLGRCCIGVDINEKYLEMAIHRCNRLL